MASRRARAVTFGRGSAAAHSLGLGSGRRELLVEIEQREAVEPECGLLVLVERRLAEQLLVELIEREPGGETMQDVVSVASELAHERNCSEPAGSVKGRLQEHPATSGKSRAHPAARWSATGPIVRLRRAA